MDVNNGKRILLALLICAVNPSFAGIAKLNSTNVALSNRTLIKTQTFSGIIHLQPISGSRTAECVYGRRDAKMSEALVAYFELVLKIVVGYVVFIFAALIGYSIGSYPGIVAIYYCMEVAMNVLVVNSSFFKIYVGPGLDYEAGVSANALVFGIYSIIIWGARLFMTFSLISSSIFAFSDVAYSYDSYFIGIRVAIGISASIYMSFYSTHFLFNEGFVSYFNGSMKDTLNGIGCSGPYSYKQLPAVVLLTEFIPFFSGLFRAADLEVLYSLVYFICSCVVVFSGFNIYHSINAVLCLGSVLLAFLFLSCTNISGIRQESSMRYIRLS